MYMIRSEGSGTSPRAPPLLPFRSAGILKAYNQTSKTPSRSQSFQPTYLRSVAEGRRQTVCGASDTATTYLGA